MAGVAVWKLSSSGPPEDRKNIPKTSGPKIAPGPGVAGLESWNPPARPRTAKIFLGPLGLRLPPYENPTVNIFKILGRGRRGILEA